MGRFDDKLKELKEKEKILKKAYKGDLQGLSDSTREYYSSVSKNHILSMLQEIKNEIKQVKKEAWKASGKESDLEDQLKDQYSQVGVNRVQ